jgi:hypothetical protein
MIIHPQMTSMKKAFNRFLSPSFKPAGAPIFLDSYCRFAGMSS